MLESLFIILCLGVIGGGLIYDRNNRLSDDIEIYHREKKEK